MASISAWSDLPQELLHIVIAGLPFPADHARFQAVCRSWRSIPSPRTLPMAALPVGLLHLPIQGGFHELHRFPGHDRCVGTTDGWLAIRTTDAQTNRHTYALINHFSKARVPLPELDAVIGDVSKSVAIHKVLLQSGLDGLVAIRTNNRNHPIILLKPGGKGDAWLPPPRSRPFTRIIDVAFLHDKLYGITRDEDLISFSVGFDTQAGRPTVTSIKGVIKHLHNNVANNLNKDVLRKRSGDYIVNDGMHFARDDEKHGHCILTIWYLVESCEELLMVRRQLQHLPCGHNITRKVEVFKADVGARAWVPVTGGGLHGHAIFVSRRFSKSVFACDQVEADAVYFIDTREVFNVRTNNISLNSLSMAFSASWLFHPGCF